jgi:anti-sigma regulatory factor (Ser/Thr protein kinase)
MKKKTITFTLTNDLAELNDLCRYCEQFGPSIGLSEKVVFQTNLALDELFTNIVSYGFTDQKEHKITVNITLDGKTLCIGIEDDGIPFDPVNAPEPDLACGMENAKVGGLGIHLIKNIMDEISYRRAKGKNILTLKKYLCVPEERQSQRA